jgi:hypothetical protein
MTEMPLWRAHDYSRHGTTTLLAAQNIAAGKFIGSAQVYGEIC